MCKATEVERDLYYHVSSRATLPKGAVQAKWHRSMALGNFLSPSSPSEAQQCLVNAEDPLI